MVQISDSNNNVALDVDKGEFHCPFCKAVGNLMVRAFVEFRMVSFFFFFHVLIFFFLPLCLIWMQSVFSCVVSLF